jgi:hypothetical protein
VTLAPTPWCATPHVDIQAALAPLVAIAERIAGVRERTGREAPSVVT